MKILLAQITPFSEDQPPNQVNVRRKELNADTGKLHLVGKSFPVTYTSPYWTKNEGGLLAYPQVGTEVLICKADNVDSYYYLQSVVDNKSIGLTSPNLRRAAGTPQKKVFMGERGSGLEIDDELGPSYMNLGVKLKSSTGKKIGINDSPSIDEISIENGLGDYLKMIAKPIGSLLTKVRSFYIKMRYDIDIMSTNGKIELAALPDGGNINLMNSGGWPKILGVPIWNPLKGNINLQTEHNDINLFTKGESGRIFIKCLNKTTGILNLINIETSTIGSRIKIKSAGNLDLEALGNLNIKATGLVNIEGAQIHLNSAPVITVPEFDSYLGLGVEI
jgi:hypothetical protein